MFAVNAATMTSGETVRLPIIDISEPTIAVGRQMVDAAAKHGFLYINLNGTDFSEDGIDRMFELVRLRQALKGKRHRHAHTVSSHENFSPRVEKRKRNTQLDPMSGYTVPS